jgi:uncharacterized protein (TIGR02246 family)
VILAAALFAVAGDDKKDTKSTTPLPIAQVATQPAAKSAAKPGAKNTEPAAKERYLKKNDNAETATVDSEDDEPGEPASKYPVEEERLLKTAEAFVQGYAKHDAKAIAALFTTDAEYVDAKGEVFQGRDTIEKTLSGFFDKNPDSTLLLDITSIRFLSPTLAIEDGTTICTVGKDGIREESRYTAIHAKIDGQWQMASVRERGASNPRQHAARLRDLDWLLGDWIDEDDVSVVRFNCRPSEDGKFLLRDFEVAIAGETVISGTQRIVWDPISGKFRAWTFDSEGGYFDGFLSRDGDRWVLSSTGMTADGQSASGKSVFTPVNSHTITWQAIDREIDGTPIEDSEEFTLVRRGPKPEAASLPEKAASTTN